MSLNTDLFKEILTKDGAVEAQKYLIEHEGYSESMARAEVLLAQFTPENQIEQKLEQTIEIPHYCMNCHQIYSAPESQLTCTHCGHDTTNDGNEEYDFQFGKVVPISKTERGYKLTFWEKIKYFLTHQIFIN